jgi:hypothetical protein
MVLAPLEWLEGAQTITVQRQRYVANYNNLCSPATFRQVM